MYGKSGIGLVLLTLLVLLIGCDGGESGSGSGSGVTDGFAGINLNIQGTLPATASGRAAVDADIEVLDMTGTSEGTITLSDIRLNIYQIELEMDDDEINSEEETEQELEIEYTGPYVVDILEGSVSPEIPYIELLPGSYDEIKLKLAKVESDHPTIDSEDPLYGNSIHMEGSYTGNTADGAVSDAPFYMSIALDEEFVFQAEEEGMVLDEGVINELIIAYRLAIWFRFDNPDTNENEVLFSGVSTEFDGSIVVGETGDNSSQWEVIMENIKASTDFGKDEDEDGELEDHEDSDDDSDED